MNMITGKPRASGHGFADSIQSLVCFPIEGLIPTRLAADKDALEELLKQMPLERLKGAA